MFRDAKKNDVFPEMHFAASVKVSSGSILISSGNGNVSDESVPASEFAKTTCSLSVHVHPVAE